MGYYKKDQWWASPFNDDPDVRRQIHLAPKVEIHDATLRDGEQTPGVVFDVDDKIRIAEMLNEVGVERIEAGMPAVSESDRRAISEIRKRNFPSKIFAFVRAKREDIDMAADCGVHGVIIEVPIGYPKLKYQFGWTWERVLESSAESIAYARSKGLYTVYFPYDTTRARMEDLELVITNLMKQAPPSSVGVVDTMGCALPQTIMFLVDKMRKLTNGLPVEVHTHNDFGMATTTELAGLAAGASCVHSCINGLGERTGNAPLEELIVAMKILLDLDNPYQISALPRVCEETARIARVPLPANKPVSGERNYMRESGIGVNLVLEEPLAMFATNPAIFGRSGVIALGKKSGRASVEYFLKKYALEATRADIDQMVSQVKQFGIESKRMLSDEEFLTIARDVLAAK